MTDEKAALIVTRRPFKEMADGTLRVQFDVEPNDKQKFLQMFPDNGDPICVVRLSDDAIAKHQRGEQFAPKPEGEHGQFARSLMRTGFFRRPDVWGLAGSDENYLQWLRGQPCVSGASVLGAGPCEGDIVAAHVRRVASGAGTGIKPVYSAVPLCHRHHEMQHKSGEAVVGGKQKMDAQRVQHLERWSKEQIKKFLNVESLRQLSPDRLAQWCDRHGIPRSECHD